MRCSLLALSSYIDTELDAEPAGELEAHLVACDRCRTAVGHLREESARIGALARVHVPDDAVHDLFSQIGLIAEEDDLPEGPVHRKRPAAVEAPPWFGAERGAALPWAPRPTINDQSEPRELIGERSPSTAVAEPPELYLWDETIDQIPTAVPAPPPIHVVPAPAPLRATEVEEMRVAHLEAGPAFTEPLPPQVMSAEPQPPDLSTSTPMVAAPQLAAGPSALQRLRDAVAVRLALRRGGASLDSGVEIVSGAGAPTWNQRARPKQWSESPPVVAAAAPPVAESPSLPPVVKPNRFSRFMARVTAEPVAAKPGIDVDAVEGDDPELGWPGDLTDRWPMLGKVDQRAEAAAQATIEQPVAAPAPAPAPDDQPVHPTDATAPLELADVLNEVAILAKPLERTAPILPPEVDTDDSLDADTRFGVSAETASEPVPGRHVRRLHSQKSDRHEWKPTRPVTGRHVLPLGGPAVGAADRDQRLWLFGAITVVLMLLGILVGRQVTQSGPLVAATVPRTAPSSHATTPPTTAPLPVATPAPAPTALIPTAPTPQQLTGATTLGNGSGGFSVADVRYGLHPNDFRLVFDMAFPNTVTGSPNTVIGYSGPTTIYVEFMGVNGASNVAAMPPGKLVVSVVPLPMARNTDRLVFKITLSKNAPFNAYYLSGARLVIDIT